MALTQISTAGVKDDAVTSGKIPANAVGSSELADNAVDTAAIADDAVTAAKIADGVVSSTALAGNIAANKLEVNDAHIIIGDANADGSLQSLSGDVTMTRTGAVTIANDAVTANKILNNAVTQGKIASDSISAGLLQSNAVTTAKIADNAVTTDKIPNSAITTAKYANDSITADHIAPEAVELQHFKHGTSSNNGKFLRANNGADPSFETVDTDLVSDTSPQLGGDLQSNGNNIVFADTDKAIFGSGTDLQIHHNGYHSYIQELGTGSLMIESSGTGMYFQKQGTSNRLADFNIDGDVKLFHNANQKFATTSSGVAVTGDYIGDNDWIKVSKETSYDTTKSPIQQNSKTYWYTRLDDSNSIQSSTFRNLAGSGGNSNSFQSTTIPVGNMTRQSDAGSFSAYHSSTNTQATRTDLAGADDFNIATKGLSMGCLVRLENTGSNGSGVIFYGDGNDDNHFFSRYKYNSQGLMIGEDTNGSDNWTAAYPTSFFNDGQWRFVVMAVATNGTLMVSINGDRLTPVRLTGSVPTPSSAHFGIQGDTYDDNAARHRFATFWWHEGVISDALVAQEYAWLKTIWTSASGLT